MISIQFFKKAKKVPIFLTLKDPVSQIPHSERHGALNSSLLNETSLPAPGKIVAGAKD